MQPQSTATPAALEHDASPTGAGAGVPLLLAFAAAIFVSAALLFLVQPMFGRMALPLLGGTPAVWNTALLFYQAALLGGYVYAHATSRWLGVRTQAAVHLGLLLVPFLVLPIALPGGAAPPADGNPALWLLGTMAVAVGLPFFVVSASSPLLQRWFASTNHKHATDPYFLYAASNTGSLLGLFAYPLLAEPLLRLRDQSRLWAVGYGVLVALFGLCALLLWRFPATRGMEAGAAQATPAEAERITLGRRTRWVLLACIPTSMMLGLTTYISTDVGSFPLLWVIPLGIYLLTFILAFAPRPIPHRRVMRALPIPLLPLGAAIAASSLGASVLLSPLHLTAFFVAALACHGALARDRPTAARLTEFYLWLSVGGVLGGAFNALVAPVVFDGITEYPLALALAWLATRPQRREDPARPRSRLERGWPVLRGVLVVALLVAVVDADVRDGVVGLVLIGALSVLLCVVSTRTPQLATNGAVAAIMLAVALIYGSRGADPLLTERGFFGLHRITRDPEQRFQLLTNGSTLHGMQSLDPARRTEPLSYYFRGGPFAQVVEQVYRPASSSRSVGGVGLGTGSTACYARPGEEWTYYEIDPIVERIARDPRYFTFLRDCAPGARVVLGDARLGLREAADGRHGLLILDAYSSDAIPIHLLTREAFALYERKLAPGGVMAVHISNRNLDLEPVLGTLSADAHLTCLIRRDASVTAAEAKLGKTGAEWAAIARSAADLRALDADDRWAPCRTGDGGTRWTDDYSSILSVFDPGR